MKATPSKDGVLRFSVTVVLRIARNDIIDCLGWQLAVYGTLPPKNRRAVMTLVKSVRSKEGDSVWTWHENDENAEEHRRLAIECVDRLFPELNVNS